MFARLENEKIAELLLKNKAEVDIQDKYGHSPLHKAAIAGKFIYCADVIAHNRRI